MTGFLNSLTNQNIFAAVWNDKGLSPSWMLYDKNLINIKHLQKQEK